VGDILADRNRPESDLRQQYPSVVPHLDHLFDLYTALRLAREVRGAIDFETQETRILFDEQRKIKKIIPIQRNDAHKLIEECMLAANVCAAKFLDHLQVPALYRVHEGPKQQKLDLLREYLAGLGLGLRARVKVTPQDYQEVLQAIEGRPDAHLIQTTLLRSMNQAVYQPENHGHFGLAYDEYTHFTSPIRRYPDLLVHRAIRSVIHSSIDTKKVKRFSMPPTLRQNELYPYQMSDMLVLGEQCSVTERRADEATRDVISWLKCEYLQDRVGEIFDGVVSSVVSFGLFVELKDLYIDGLVHITALPQDYYVHHAAQSRLIGDRTRKVFALGDELRVQVVNVNLDERKIDFEVVEIKTGKRKKLAVSEKAKMLALEAGQKPKAVSKAGHPKKMLVNTRDDTSSKGKSKATAKGKLVNESLAKKNNGNKPTKKNRPVDNAKKMTKAKVKSVGDKAIPPKKAKPKKRVKNNKIKI
jgi:ribonuclease R